MQNVKLVTIDVWDTLIRRVCHPDAVKVHTCRFLLLTHFFEIKDDFRTIAALLNARRGAEAHVGEIQKNKGFDDEYQIREVYAYWLKSVLKSVVDLGGSVDELFNSELSQEYKVSYRDPEIIQVLNQYPSVKKIFVSDFYMGAIELKSLLTQTGYGGEISTGYSSCDIRLNKRSGNIFPYVLGQEEVDAKNVMHIGDNAHSDVYSPSRFGIQTTHFLPKEQHELRLARESAFDNQQTLISSALSSLTIEASLETNSARAKALYSCGINSSPLLIGFVLDIMEKAIKFRHKKVFFFTREGEFFKQIYDVLAAQDPFGVPVPEAVLLEVSRVATFSASLPCASLDVLMRIWTLYSTQSIQALFRSLGINIQSFSNMIESYGIPLELDIQYPWLDDRFKALFNDEEFKVRLETELALKRNRLLGYLKSKDFPLEGKAAIVDIGWRGTIQDNLAHLLPDVHLDGFYLGLDKFLNSQPDNTKKYAFGPNRNDLSQSNSTLFGKVAPIEMLCNSPSGSVTGYKDDGGSFLAEKLIQGSENSIFYESVTYFQQGVICAAEKIGAVVRLHAVMSEAFKDLAVSCWTEIVDRPPAIIADTFFKLNHNESFGLGRFDDKSAVIPSMVWMKACISVGGLKNLIRALESTGWPEGYLSQRGLLWIWTAIHKARQTKSKLTRRP
ncbi:MULTISPECIES: HAD family hydrolase [Pseudomonas]|uniref:HAD family hydrolase n=1 Tax=Pseudomonas TaxID=286 RepID=UPI000A95B7B1|nr:MULTISPECIES: HAD family hydrolase [Pseudomonas]UUT21632.1 hypothetical protein NRG23_28645 [Pseudomonas sp. T8]